MMCLKIGEHLVTVVHLFMHMFVCFLLLRYFQMGVENAKLHLFFSLHYSLLYLTLLYSWLSCRKSRLLTFFFFFLLICSVVSPLQWPQGERPWPSYFPSCSSPNLSLSSKCQCLFFKTDQPSPLLALAARGLDSPGRCLWCCSPEPPLLSLPSPFPTRPLTPVRHRKTLVSRRTSAALATSPTRSPSLTFRHSPQPAKNAQKLCLVLPHPTSFSLQLDCAHLHSCILYFYFVAFFLSKCTFCTNFATPDSFFFFCLTVKSLNTNSTAHQMGAILTEKPSRQRSSGGFAVFCVSS